MTYHEGHSPDCVFCKHNHDFEIPRALLNSLKAGRLTIFAGAGVSTEVGAAFPTTLYEELRNEAELDDDPSLSFPAVMSAYERRWGRRALISAIVERFEYMDTFPFITQAATRFHQALSTLTPVQKIITTNWDTSFEDFCGARAFVSDEDYAYYDLDGRKVFKIHGSVRNVSSIVATEEDYENREMSFRSSAMGSSLKHFLATEAVVFIGYSLSDPDFQSVYRGLLQGLGRSRPPAYFVSPYPSEQAQIFGLQTITTDGTHFIAKLKKALVDDGVLFDDSVLVRLDLLRQIIPQARRVIETSAWREHAPLFFSLPYLDGMSDAAQSNLVRATRGEISMKDKMTRVIRTYDSLHAHARATENWWDAAYVHGYLTVLISLFMDDQQFATIDLFETYADEQEDLEPQPVFDGRDEAPTNALSLPARPVPDDIRMKFESLPADTRGSVNAAFAKLATNFSSTGVPRHTPFIDELMTDFEENHRH